MLEVRHGLLFLCCAESGHVDLQYQPSFLMINLPKMSSAHHMSIFLHVLPLLLPLLP
jgi:hypothetical protein